MGNYYTKQQLEFDEQYISSKKIKKPTIKVWPDPKTISRVPRKGEIVNAYVYKVYDGDTCSVLYEYGTKIININIRVMGVDCPEINSNSDSLEMKTLEKKAAIYIRDKVQKLILDNDVKIKLIKWDKYGGRVVGAIFLPSKFENKWITLTEYLLANEYGKPYCGSKKNDWTKKELIKIFS